METGGKLQDTVKPDVRDVIVQHVSSVDDASGSTRDRWLVFLGQSKRAEMEDSHRAMVFARLLADLNQGRIWVLHDADGLKPVDSGSIRGCSCC
jgi:hypothetical protein